MTAPDTRPVPIHEAMTRPTALPPATKEISVNATDRLDQMLVDVAAMTAQLGEIANATARALGRLDGRTGTPPRDDRPEYRAGHAEGSLDIQNPGRACAARRLAETEGLPAVPPAAVAPSPGQPGPFTAQEQIAEIVDLVRENTRLLQHATTRLDRIDQALNERATRRRARITTRSYL